MSIPGPASFPTTGDQVLPVVMDAAPPPAEALLPVVASEAPKPQAAAPLPESAVAAPTPDPLQPAASIEAQAVPGPEMLANGAAAATLDTAQVADLVEAQLSKTRNFVAAHLPNANGLNDQITALRDRVVAEVSLLSPTAAAAALLSDAPDQPAPAEPTPAQAAIAGAESADATLPGALPAEPNAASTPSTEVSAAAPPQPLVKPASPALTTAAKPENFADGVGPKPAESHLAEQVARAELATAQPHQVA